MYYIFVMYCLTYNIMHTHTYMHIRAYMYVIHCMYIHYSLLYKQCCSFKTKVVILVAGGKIKSSYILGLC